MDPNSADLELSPLVITNTPVYCARIKGGSVSLEELNAAQKTLQLTKTFEAILRNYY